MSQMASRFFQGPVAEAIAAARTGQQPLVVLLTGGRGGGASAIEVVGEGLGDCNPPAHPATQGVMKPACG